MGPSGKFLWPDSLSEPSCGQIQQDALLLTRASRAEKQRHNL